MREKNASHRRPYIHVSLLNSKRRKREEKFCKHVTPSILLHHIPSLLRPYYTSFSSHNTYQLHTLLTSSLSLNIYTVTSSSTPHNHYSLHYYSRYTSPSPTDNLLPTSTYSLTIKPSFIKIHPPCLLHMAITVKASLTLHPSQSHQPNIVKTHLLQLHIHSPSCIFISITHHHHQLASIKHYYTKTNPSHKLFSSSQ